MEAINTIVSKKEDLLMHFLLVRKQTEDLCKPLVVEDFVISATEDTSPPKWHLAHTSWFFENFVIPKLVNNYTPFHSEYSFLFNSYYKRLGPHLAKSKRGVLSRPTTVEVMEYRKNITTTLQSAVRQSSEENFQEISEILELGIQHEQQHQELLLMDIKRNFFENPMRPHYNHDASHGAFASSDVVWHNIPSGPVRIGVDKADKEFAFDNEKDAHTYWIESFMLSSHLVTNEEYLSFVEAGGYENPLLWLSDGWEVKEKENWKHPLYWENDKDSWWTMTLGGMMPLDYTAPVVHISFYEAWAYAKWKGCRLPTEYEWEAAAQMERSEDVFMEEGSFEPSPAQEDHQYFAQIHGSIWEWTQSAYSPYPRYERFHHGLSEYNEKFMCNQFVLRGGSCITPRSHYRLTYRNFYYPHMRWQYAGLRLAKDLA